MKIRMNPARKSYANPEIVDDVKSYKNVSFWTVEVTYTNGNKENFYSVDSVIELKDDRDLLDKNHPNTILNMYDSKRDCEELFASLLDYSVEDFIKSKLKHPISPNIIREIDSVLTQQYLEDVDYSKYTVSK